MDDKVEKELSALIEELKAKVPHDELMKALNDLYFMPKDEFNELVVTVQKIEEITNQ